MADLDYTPKASEFDASFSTFGRINVMLYRLAAYYERHDYESAFDVLERLYAEAYIVVKRKKVKGELDLFEKTMDKLRNDLVEEVSRYEKYNRINVKVRPARYVSKHNIKKGLLDMELKIRWELRDILVRQGGDAGSSMA